MSKRLPSRRQDNYRETSGTWYTLSAALTVLSLLSIYLAYWVVSLISATSLTSLKNTWVLYLFIPLPLALIIFGLIKKKHGFRHKASIAVGVTMVILLAVFGSFRFIFFDSYDFENSLVTMAETETGIDLPDDYLEIASKSYGDSSMTTMILDAAQTAQYVRCVEEDGRWLSELPDSLLEISSSAGYYYTEGYSLLYCCETARFNEPPDVGGTYRFIQLNFNPERQDITLMEYAAELN